MGSQPPLALIRGLYPLSAAIARLGVAPLGSHAGETRFPCPNGCAPGQEMVSVNDEKGCAIGWCPCGWDGRGVAYDSILAAYGRRTVPQVRDWLRSQYEANPSQQLSPVTPPAAKRSGAPIQPPFKKWGRPATHAYYFRDATGTPVAVNCRYRVRPDEKIHCQFAVVNGVVYDRQPPRPYPLYNLNNIVRHTSHVVVVNEGCNKACALNVMLREHPLVGTGWMMGAAAWKSTDWSPLKNRTVLIVPDNDPPGLSAADGIATHLASLPVRRDEVGKCHPHRL